jgi:hypothetical protein
MFCFFLSFFLFITASLPVPVNAAEKMETYQNTQKGYSIQYPSTWTRHEDIKNFDVFLLAPKGSNELSVANVSIISGKLPPDVSQDLYYTLNLKELLNSNSTIQIKDNCKSNLGNIEAFWLRYTRDENPAIEVIQYLFAANHIGFVLTVGAVKDQFEDYQDVFDQIIKSFKLLESQPSNERHTQIAL